MIIKSLLTVRHTINSIEEIKNWIDSRNKTVKVQVDSRFLFLRWKVGKQMRMEH